jgi:general L-amino acid transport system permease protein
MAVQETMPAHAGGLVPALNDQRVRGVVFQVLLIVAIVTFAWWIIQNTAANLRNQGLPFGFEVLGDNAGFQIDQTLIPYSRTATYARVYVVGLLNTLMVAVTGIALATLVGFIVGIGRLSTNWIVNRIAYVYIEVVRNIPLLLQIFIWYFAVLRLLPARRDALDLGPLGLLNISGYYAPQPVFQDGAGLIGLTLAVGIAATVLVRIWARRRQLATGERFPVGWTALGLILGLPVLVWLAAAAFYGAAPVEFVYAEMGRFGPRGGARLYPEFVALWLALSIYTAAFIAEIVRAGILAVSWGQTEAAYSLGLRPGPTLRLIVVPQALRIIIPPLTSQYLNLTKNSSLAVAIGYPDLVSVFAGTALNQTGRAIEFILITMGTYLTISLITSAFMNWYNRAVALVER